MSDNPQAEEGYCYNSRIPRANVLVVVYVRLICTMQLD